MLDEDGNELDASRFSAVFFHTTRLEPERNMKTHATPARTRSCASVKPRDRDMRVRRLSEARLLESQTARQEKSRAIVQPVVLAARATALAFTLLVASWEVEPSL